MVKREYPVEFSDTGDEPTFEQAEERCDDGECWYTWSRYCGAKVCAYCGDHDGLAHCYCGFGGGRSYLEGAGEVIDEEDY